MSENLSNPAGGEERQEASKAKDRGPDLITAAKHAIPFERKYPRFFVGREDVLAGIQACCHHAMDWVGAKQTAPGLTSIVQGAPGAGKSSLLEHLKRSLGGENPQAHFLTFSEDRLPDTAAVVVEIAHTIEPDKAEEFHQTTTSGKSGKAGFSAPSYKQQIRKSLPCNHIGKPPNRPWNSIRCGDLHARRPPDPVTSKASAPRMLLSWNECPPRTWMTLK